ncbi:hypothetical protein [Lentibacillus salicampi]|uniref:Uncharacterized protein n=1 Tax=Lentibacillus salicampi TaxID=175306 RepID=A0A4Y9AC16_9BACI|nr:hypothetical protein [Lentibacillus salicampi]TFJ93439.1 hypothetical protein E4U82_07165 [Lentibacillus salicampi]
MARLGAGARPALIMAADHAAKATGSCFGIDRPARLDNTALIGIMKYQHTCLLSRTGVFTFFRKRALG